MLKALGVTMAQVTQRLRPTDASSEPGRHERAQDVARRAERRRRLGLADEESEAKEAAGDL